MIFRLIWYEFRKHYINALTGIIVVALLGLNAWKITTVQEEKSILSDETFCEAYWKFYDQYSGVISLEKITDLLKLYQPIKLRVESDPNARECSLDSYTYSDYMDALFLERCYIDEMKYDYLYQNYAYGIESQARENIEFYQSKGNAYEVKKNAKIIELFENRVIEKFEYTEGLYYYLFYDFSLILILFLCIYAMSGVYVLEKETEMDKLIRTSSNGGMTTSFAKLCSATLFVVGVCVLFFVEDLLFFCLEFYSFFSWDAPLYTLPAFRETPLDMNVGQYIGFMNLLKIIGVIGCCTLFLWISSYCGKVFFPFGAGIFVSIGMVYVQGRSVGNNLLQFINPMELAIGRDMVMKIRFINILGIPVLQYKVMIVGNVLWILLFLLGLIWKGRSRKGALRER